MQAAHRRTPAIVLILLLTAAAPNSAQTADPQADPLGPPTERGIRLTPEMVRMVSNTFAREMLTRRYELEASQTEQAGEAVARRVMSAAHAHGEQAQALLEMFITEVVEDDARTREPGHRGEDTFMTPEFCRRLGEQVVPLIPTLREIVRDVGQDLRPMLPLKQQLKLAADLAMANTVLGAFEHNMQRWARGEALPGEDPFSDDSGASARDADGASKALQQARKSAENELDKEARTKTLWESYLAQTKTFYALDPGQCATADSVYREFMGRLQTQLADPQWSREMYRTRLWLSLSQGVGLAWHTPLRQMLDRKYQAMMDPINEMGNEFRIRLDQIPTTAQRATAETRMEQALAAHGFESSSPAETK